MVSFLFLFSQSWRVEEENGADNIIIHQLEDDLGFNDKFASMHDWITAWNMHVIYF